MATLDIFNDDAFAVTRLSQTITDIPEVPTLLGEKNLFAEEGISTTTFWIERQGASIALVPSAPRGGVRQPVALGPRKMIPLPTIHLPQSWSVLADEVQNIRAFGSETEVETVQKLVARKMAVARQSMDLTHEYQRVGALKGRIMDADGTTELLDLYDAFGMTQQQVFFDIASASSSADPKMNSVALKRAIRSKLGGRRFTGVRVIVSEGFFDKLVGHNAMKKAWELWNQGAYLRQDQSAAGDFEFAGVTYEIYSGGLSNGDFIEDGVGYAYPEGVPGMFQTKFAPADYMETVNTEGLPYYAKQERMSFDKGVIGEAQSNPIHFNTLPEAVIKVSVAAS